MWEVEIIAKSVNEGTLYVTVEFSNGEKKFKETYTTKDVPGDGWLKNLILNRITKVSALIEFESTLQKGKFDLTVDPVPDPTPPTQEEIDEQNRAIAYAEKSVEFEARKKLVDLGILTEEEAELANFRDELKELVNLESL